MTIKFLSFNFYVITLFTKGNQLNINEEIVNYEK